MLIKLLHPYIKPGASWVEVIKAAAAAGVDLKTAVEGRHMVGGEYFIYCAGASEVELDVLTGECQILRADLVYLFEY